MMFWNLVTVSLAALPFINALRWHPDHVGYNLNENQTATHPRDYWGEWDNHTYHPSPRNWRFPFYMLTIDRYVDGDPTNNEANGTVFEHHWLTNQFRYGGDAKGLQDDLDYIQGLGMKALYLVGSPFLNRPWSGDGFGPLDFTLLDRHHGAIEDWRSLIAEIHRRGMYVIFDNTMATMGDLIAFDGFVNASTPFNWQEYDYLWKTETRYHDFQPGNERNASCEYPRIWGQDGFPLTQDILDQMDGCRDSEFDQYGDIKSTGAYPSYINSMSKFASVQDRLREWRPDVLEKIKRMSCMQIAMFDIDGFRMDKALQTTVDAMAEFADYQRQCARMFGKENFLMVGEIVGDPNLASVYVGRGKQPDQALTNPEDSVVTNNETNPDTFIRPFGMSAMDGAAFHYDIYGAMTRFLGLDSPWGARGVDWVEQWNFMLTNNDMVNANTGEYDPRHMFGMTNHDVFRWPALANGTQRQYLGYFVTMLELPGVPMILWGEEQEFYVLENLANDYVFGRQPMGSSSAWQLHGCYGLGETVYVDMPFDSSGYGCNDDSVSLDHRDPAKPMRNVLKRMFELRLQYPALNDGYNLTTLSTKIYNIYLPGSGGIPSPHGLWSVYRGRSERIQDFSGIGQGNQGVWLVFSNENTSTTYEFDCTSSNTSLALISAFPADTTIKNLFYPYEEFTLESSVIKYGIEGSTEFNGCLPRLETAAWDYKAFVPKDKWLTPGPTITRTIPSHDARIQSTVEYEGQESLPIEIGFSSEMSCDSVTNGIEIHSTTETGSQARLDEASVNCTLVDADPPRHVGEIPSAWIFSANLENVYNGVHTVTVRNVSTVDGDLSTNTVDRFMFRIGQPDNPMVFTKLANYTTTLLHRGPSPGNLYISPRAAGADKIRYSRNWGSTFSNWLAYTGGNITLEEQSWSGTTEQEWAGDHVVVHYWSQKTGSSDHVQHADLDRGGLPPRRFPHVFVHGEFNQYGYDGGLPSDMQLHRDGLWKYDLVADFPDSVIFNVWGMNPDGVPDKSHALGDADGDNVLDWLPPDSLARNLVDISSSPPRGYLGYRLEINDGTYQYSFSPVGSSSNQLVVSVLLCLVPIVTAILGIWTFMKVFYQVKFNRIGVDEKSGILGFMMTGKSDNERLRSTITNIFHDSKGASGVSSVPPSAGAAVIETRPSRRTILIATLEYEIEDLDIKIKIGGLGVMSSLMGKHLTDHGLIWVVPCVGGIEYPADAMAYPMDVTILGQKYEISVQYHAVNNITFVLLDAPIFRKQTKANPYPARMDDLESAIFYSAWNQCIALAIERFEVDIYHINDYHGAAAPLYLLPRVIPCCLSLHNAEFQGLWSLGTPTDMNEVCRVFNLEKDIVERYIQFGGVFNLLHAAASYLRIHQRGFGAVGVSGKYGRRSKQRYPIFWSLPKIGSLPNPDPADTALAETPKKGKKSVEIDSAMEANRAILRCRAQEWAGLNVDPEAELFVFVGRWSRQKGIDIIADVFFSVLNDNPRAQLICVGPVIDLYGKFAALKLEKLMALFPGRVYSKPEFTALPPFIFSGAEFALIPSRDEPFGLVAVEFGRKGALGVGSKVGGLGQMPGWWYTVESLTSKHLIQQFKQAIRSALASDQATRAKMRARALVQRFPVQQWVEDLDKLQANSIRVSRQQQEHSSLSQTILRTFSPSTSGWSTPTFLSRPHTPVLDEPPSPSFGAVSSSRGVSLLDTSVEALPNAGGDHSPHTNTHGSISSSIEELQLPNVGSRTWSRTRNSSPHLSRLAIPRDSSQISEEGGSGIDSLRGSSRNSPHSSQPPSPAPVPLSSVWNLRRSGRASTIPPSLSMLQSETPSEEFGADPASRNRNRFSYSSIVDKKKDFELQKVDVTFSDSQDEFYNNFARKLNKIDAKSSEDRLCIEEFLTKSEKAWFGRFHRAKLGMDPEHALPTTLPGLFRWLKHRWQRPGESLDANNEAAQGSSEGQQSAVGSVNDNEFLLGSDYEPPNGIKKLLQKKIGDWQLYTFLLAFGQIIAANSYQITILTGDYGKAADKLYAAAAVYIAATVAWWCLFRRVKALYVVSLPFAFYGLAFFILGMGLYAPNTASRDWIFNVATGLYAFASASGSLYFVLNFGTEGGTPAQTWAYRACVIQGTQQIYVAFLWYWGATLNRTNNTNGPPVSSRAVTAITVPIAVFMWTVGIILYLGLPNYYRRHPGNVPSFYRSLFRRKTVIWFFVMVILQNYFLSATYNRNWKFLWSSQHTPTYTIILLLLLFFILIWTLLLLILGHLSQTHAWLIPIFAISLGAPRWCQMLWSTSGIALYLPLLRSNPMIGALISRSLWLWLGVLDALQGIGFGMILLQTLTRFHVAATLCASQVLGSLMTIAARATAPNKVGPGDVFPNFGLIGAEGLRRPWFWVALLSQLVVCVGFAKVFRKEQLFKP